MGRDATAFLCYGIHFPGEWYEFPWGDDDIEGWWLDEVLGWKPPFPVFDANGEYINGVRPPDEKITEYFKSRWELKKANPMPVSLVFYGSDEYAQYILCTPSSVKRADWNDAKQIGATLLYSEAEEAALLNFCERFGLEGDGPAWWLAARWF